MAITFPCPQCGVKLRAPEDAGGKKVKCPRCGNVPAVPLTVLAAHDDAVQERPGVVPLPPAPSVSAEVEEDEDRTARPARRARRRERAVRSPAPSTSGQSWMQVWLIYRFARLGMLLVFLSLCLTCIGISALTGLWGLHQESKRLAPFEPHLAEYAQEPREADDLDQPYVRGKVLPFDVQDGKVDYPILFRLPEALSPQGPEEVGTVARLEWRQEKLGYTREDHLIYRPVCHLVLVDWSNQTVIGEHEIKGARTVALGHTETGTTWRPTEEVAEYLISLPRK